MTAIAERVAAGEPVTLTVTVTAGHIAAGKLRDCNRCPIALAITDAWRPVPQFDEADAQPGLLYAWFSQPSAGGYTTCTPAEAEDFMGLYDLGQHVEPFTFTSEWRPVP